MEKKDIPLAPVELEGVKQLDLVVRNIDGEGVLFTRAGEMIGQQISHMGHYYYIGHGKDRRKMFRATFLVDSMKSDIPNGDK
jgi:hypothetical protein